MSWFNPNEMTGRLASTPVAQRGGPQRGSTQDPFAAMVAPMPAMAPERPGVQHSRPSPADPVRRSAPVNRGRSSASERARAEAMATSRLEAQADATRRQFVASQRQPIAAAAQAVAPNQTARLQPIQPTQPLQAAPVATQFQSRPGMAPVQSPASLPAKLPEDAWLDRMRINPEGWVDLPIPQRVQRLRAAGCVQSDMPKVIGFLDTHSTKVTGRKPQCGPSGMPQTSVMSSPGAAIVPAGQPQLVKPAGQIAMSVSIDPWMILLGAVVVGGGIYWYNKHKKGQKLF